MLERRKGIDGFILKDRSPSCGTKDAKVYESVDSEEIIDRATGFFAIHLLSKCKSIPIETIDSLNDDKKMKHFLLSLS